MTMSEFRELFHGPLIANCGIPLNRPKKSHRKWLHRFGSIGRPFISNPDLVERWKNTGHSPPKPRLPIGILQRFARVHPTIRLTKLTDQSIGNGQRVWRLSAMQNIDPCTSMERCCGIDFQVVRSFETL